MRDQAFLNYLATSSRYGGLARVFMITALGVYADTVVKGTSTPMALISEDMWKALAEEVLAKLEKEYGFKESPSVEDQPAD